MNEKEVFIEAQMKMGLSREKAESRYSLYLKAITKIKSIVFDPKFNPEEKELTPEMKEVFYKYIEDLKE
jgi:hypothetical protein